MLDSGVLHDSQQEHSRSRHHFQQHTRVVRREGAPVRRLLVGHSLAVSPQRVQRHHPHEAMASTGDWAAATAQAHCSATVPQSGRHLTQSEKKAPDWLGRAGSVVLELPLERLWATLMVEVEGAEAVVVVAVALAPPALPSLACVPCQYAPKSL